MKSFLRSTLLIIVKWFVSFFLSAGLLYILPMGFRGLGRDILVVFFTSVIALVFAEWIFKHTAPTHKDIGILMLQWLALTCAISALVDLYMWGYVAYLILDPVLKVQYGMEVIMIPLAAHFSRVRRSKL